jgi:hypothetical protein
MVFQSRSCRVTRRDVSCLFLGLARQAPPLVPPQADLPRHRGRDAWEAAGSPAMHHGSLSGRRAQAPRRALGRVKRRDPADWEKTWTPASQALQIRLGRRRRRTSREREVESRVVGDYDRRRLDPAGHTDAHHHNLRSPDRGQTRGERADSALVRRVGRAVLVNRVHPRQRIACRESQQQHHHGGFRRERPQVPRLRHGTLPKDIAVLPEAACRRSTRTDTWATLPQVVSLPAPLPRVYPLCLQKPMPRFYSGMPVFSGGLGTTA